MIAADITARLARSLAIARIESGLSHDEIAALVGPPIRRVEVVAWENGKRRISERYLLRLIDIFDSRCDEPCHDIGWWYADHRDGQQPDSRFRRKPDYES